VFLIYITLLLAAEEEPPMLDMALVESVFSQLTSTVCSSLVLLVSSRANLEIAQAEPQWAQGYK
jgi:hypothetical protein